MDTFDRRGINVLKRDPHPQAQARKWLLQENRSYKPDFSGNQTQRPMKFDDNQLE
jgi:hypothetical protein